MIKRRNKFSKYAVPSAFGIAIIASLIASAGDMQQKSQGFKEMSRRANVDMFNQVELELSNESVKKQQAISAERVKSFGCRVMVNSSGSALASLRRSAQVTNRGVRTPLAPGNCVLGANGETGIIREDGSIGAIAAGRPEYAQQALKRVRGTGKVYYYHAKAEERQ